MDENTLFVEAVGCYREKDFAGAEKSCRQILAANPQHAHAIHLMAAIGKDVENYDMAEGLARMAIDIDPTVADFYFTLGLIKQKQKKFEESLVHFQKAVDIDPNHHRALIDLANVCKDIGSLQRNDNLLDGALSFYNRALAIRAEEDIYYGIAHTHYLKGDYISSIAAGQAGLKRHPDSIKILQALSGTYNYMQHYEQALECCEKILELEPTHYSVYSNIGSILKNTGHLDEAIIAFKKSLQGQEDSWTYGNLLLSMVYSSSVTPEELAQTARAYGEKIADPLIRKRPFKNNKSPTRKLRIGYISPDFRDHAVRYFLAPVFHCDKNKFELYAYSKNERDDAVTERLKTYFDHWRDIKYYKEDRAADIIEEDKIDILVDLAGHTGYNGLAIMARKPAPIQVTWLGYPATTGMRAMDYRMTDSYAEPVGMTEYLNTESLWRLPDIFCAYEAHENSPAVIDHPPSEDNGYITFGCFNNFTKVTDDVLAVWGKIMSQVPQSRILLEIAGLGSEKMRAEVEERLARHLPMERVTIEIRNKLNQFILYNKIDIALDPFPCNGGTTSMDTLWMGVPFVTLAGKHFVSRMGVTILTNAGLPELIAQNTDEYISKAVDLATDKEKLHRTRQGLRERFAASPVMDQERFARNMEHAFREMWKKWVSN